MGDKERKKGRDDKGDGAVWVIEIQMQMKRTSTDIISPATSVAYPDTCEAAEKREALLMLIKVSSSRDVPQNPDHGGPDVIRASGSFGSLCRDWEGEWLICKGVLRVSSSFVIKQWTANEHFGDSEHIGKRTLINWPKCDR